MHWKCGSNQHCTHTHIQSNAQSLTTYVVPSLDWIGWAEAVGQKEGQQLANSHLLQPARELTPVFNQKMLSETCSKIAYHITQMYPHGIGHRWCVWQVASGNHSLIWSFEAWCFQDKSRNPCDTGIKDKRKGNPTMSPCPYLWMGHTNQLIQKLISIEIVFV